MDSYVVEWTVDRIIELCKEYCQKCNVIFNAPVSINGRLKKTLGRCFYDGFEGNYYPTRMEFSKQFLETATEETIKNVIAHECAHYVTTAITHEAHGHDHVFKYYCHQIGTTNDTPTTKVKTIKPKEEIYKYTFYCECCGKFVAGRHRACKLTKNPAGFISNCCNAPLFSCKNW